MDYLSDSWMLLFPGLIAWSLGFILVSYFLKMPNLRRIASYVCLGSFIICIVLLVRVKYKELQANGKPTYDYMNVPNTFKNFDLSGVKNTDTTNGK